MKPLARYASLNGYLDLCRSLRIDPVPLLKGAGLDPAGLGLQDRWIPAAAIAKVLEDSAALSGCEDFGLRLAERRQFSNLGPLSLVVREESDIRQALRILSRYQHMYNEALNTRITELNDIATIRIEPDLGEPVDVRQFTELAVAITHRLLVGFLGARWRPLAVCFTHPAPTTQMGTHRHLFGPVVNFDHDFSGIVLVASDLDAPNRMSDPLLQPYTQQLLDSFGSPNDVTIAGGVRESIELLLPTGRCSAEQVARSLGSDRRTVHNHLARTGESYSSILNSTRADLAERMVGNSGQTFTEIADLLSFSARSNFSRWFHRQFGCSPRQWRARQHNAQPAQGTDHHPRRARRP
ncbi:AraC family transcriptional regulator [Rhodococcus sp. IEGM 1351]|uniref:AraC family transcriptional regulator n=1 Tax=Rhodococcus sp. IEGM 1351 TaxID=3047089 RepID=UPI0024B67668|nr:AraC family transcriptional regulator [Rhodococcus sp. IEGM 1351]MDI9938837.1 AraC family transcriptional regulator [Rhodococcus sp. IEGM 1351]